MEQTSTELLNRICSDIGEVKANINNIDKTLNERRAIIDGHAARIRRLELIVLPVTAAVSYVGYLIF